MAVKTVIAAWVGDQHLSRPHLSRLGTGLLIAGVLGGCGGSAGAAASSPTKTSSTSVSKPAIAACATKNTTRVARLVLSDILPVPKLSVRPGAVVEVISSFAKQQMLFPTPLGRRSAAVCEISQHRDRTGAASVTYRLLRQGTVTFTSSYTHPSPLADPALAAQVTVKQTSKAR